MMFDAGRHGSKERRAEMISWTGIGSIGHNRVQEEIEYKVNGKIR